MSGITDLSELIASMEPELHDQEFVFVVLPGGAYGDGADLRPIGAFGEKEGLTLIVPAERARSAGLRDDDIFRMITLTVHSSLSAVGLTAAVAHALTDRGISANVVAAFHHDHVFVPAERAEEALAALRALSLSAA
ncbi:MAG: ACT domain-containing protein [Rhodothermales bacterium]|nr:ACT domain-containing protein [Rhodothermales bacterium]